MSHQKSFSQQQSDNSEGVDVVDTACILSVMAREYCRKTPLPEPKDIQVMITDEESLFSIHLAADQEPQIRMKEDPSATFRVKTDQETLRRLYQGDISPLTAAGRESIANSAPLDFDLLQGQSLSMDLMREIIEFSSRFFNPSDPEMIRFGLEHSRVIHGANATALFYGQDFRSAWYCVQQGKQINEPGDTNPFPQGFIVLSGQGVAQLGERTVTIKPNEAYYIPPNSDHVIRNEHPEPLTCIWLAWGEGA